LIKTFKPWFCFKQILASQNLTTKQEVSYMSTFVEDDSYAPDELLMEEEEDIESNPDWDDIDEDDDEEWEEDIEEEEEEEEEEEDEDWDEDWDDDWEEDEEWEESEEDWLEGAPEWEGDDEWD
jgi:hypothetical protein